MSVIYLPLKTKNFKIGYSVSKKVGKAFIRNKVKRRLKECVLKLSNNIKNELIPIIINFMNNKPKIRYPNYLNLKI